ncbi:MAG: cytochrome c [Planctomycetes bacterium]|nr:cytochrome c [Planctomycetota bacterium]
MKKLLALALLLAACSPGNGAFPGVNPDPEQGAATAFAALPTAEETQQLAQRGKLVFAAEACASCHSNTSDRMGLLGPPMGGVLQRNLGRGEGDALKTRRWLFLHVRDAQRWPGAVTEAEAARGIRMPVHPRIPDEDLKALVEYLCSLQ